MPKINTGSGSFTGWVVDNPPVPGFRVGGSAFDTSPTIGEVLDDYDKPKKGGGSSGGSASGGGSAYDGKYHPPGNDGGATAPGVGDNVTTETPVDYTQGDNEPGEPWYRKYLWLEIAAAILILGIALFLIFGRKKK